MKLTANRIAGMIRESGHKLTPQRYAVLKVIAAQRDHLSVEEIYKKALEQNPRIGLVTIYRTLELLGKLNLVCRIHSANGCRDYLMMRPSEHHHHLICSECGRTLDFTDCDLTSLEKKLSSSTGFEIEGHLLELYGKCDACRKPRSN